MVLIACVWLDGSGEAASAPPLFWPAASLIEPLSWALDRRGEEERQGESWA